VAVSRPGQASRRIIDSTDDVDVLTVTCQRLQAGGQFVVGTVLARDPVLLDDPVAVEPQYESGVDRLGGDAGPSRVGCPARIKHRLERR